MGGYRSSYRPTYNRRSTSRRTSYQRPKAKPGPRASIKRKSTPVIRRRPKPKTVSKPTKKISPRPKYTPSRAGMPTSVQNIIVKNRSTTQTSKYQKGGVPFVVANKLAERETTKQASKQSVTTPAKQVTVSKPTQTVSTGVSYQKTNTLQAPKQDTYAKIYKKPINTPVNPKVEKKNKTLLEDISLENGKNLNVNKQEKVEFKQRTDLMTEEKQNIVDKTILSENKPMYLTTREGKRIRVDNGLYKKDIKENIQSLKIRQMISEPKKRRTETNEKNIATSMY